jgi:hydroxymethylpyrimidine pyrophosphatase-like HAD family hydrolase
MSTPEEVEKLYPIIRAEYPEYSFTISKPYFLEAQPHDVSKGSALRRLSGIMGFTPDSTMAFGDSLNDISMFDFAVHSVAMMNARDEVKQAARYVTELPNTQDGLAHFLRTHVLL